MLLLIALANAPHYRYGNAGHSVGGQSHLGFDQVALLLQLICIKGRAYPLFALLFGYGIVQLRRRHTGSGVDEIAVCKLVRRRGWWMVLIGFLHALLLFSADIIGAYGLLAVLLAEVLVRARDRTLLILAALWTVPMVLFRTLEGRLSPLTGKASSMTDPLHSAGMRVLEWLQCSVVGSVCTLVPAVLLGVWAARRGLLDEPERHRTLLLRIAVLGIGLAVAGGLPWALVRSSWWQPQSAAVTMIAGAVHALTGYAGGVGYAAVAGLVAIRVQAGARGWSARVISALAACGQRSMTCYLLQSVVFVAVLAAYGGGLGNRLGLGAIALLATATWALSVLLADAMRRHGYRGPTEVLLRHLTYGSPTTSPVVRR